MARASTADGAIRVLLANVLVRNDQHERMLELASAADADVLIFQEVDDRWLEALAPLRRTHPYTVGRSRDDAFGIAVFSRVPFDDSDVENLVAGGRPSIGLDLSVDGRPVTLLATHPTHPVSPRTFRLRNEQLEALAAFIRGRSGPVVLVGDLNVTMWSPWYRRLCDETELVNARRGFGVLPSWPTFLPVVSRVPIDHCLVSDDVVVSDCRLGPPVGSDHLPLIVDLVIPE